MSATTSLTTAVRPRSRASRKRSRRWALILSYTFLLVFVIFFLTPPYHMIVTSLKSDIELAQGFLLTEGVIAGRDDVHSIRYCAGRDDEGANTYNVLDVTLAAGVPDSAETDVAIVGAGVVGCAIARELCRFDLRVTLLEAGPDVGAGTSKAKRMLGFQAQVSLENGLAQLVEWWRQERKAA